MESASIAPWQQPAEAYCKAFSELFKRAALADADNWLQVPNAPDTIVTNAGYVFLDSQATAAAPTLPNRANMTNEEVAHAIFGM